jgi:hypothetical protein
MEAVNHALDHPREQSSSRPAQELIARRHPGQTRARHTDEGTSSVQPLVNQGSGRCWGVTQSLDMISDWEMPAGVGE